jgi:hypothetical protein
MGKLIPSVVRHLEDTFSVRETQSQKIRRKSCARQDISDSLYKKTVKADLIIVLTATAPDKSESWVAWASACEQHATTYRPIMGRVNFNVRHLRWKEQHFFDQFGTLLHEIYHVLGFAKNLYKYYIDPVTMKRRPIKQTYITKPGAYMPHRLLTPKVLEFAREYFSCPNMDGVPIENDGGDGTKGSHWEKMILANEVMVGDTSLNPVISKFSLALFEDTGWYQVNYDMAEPIFWAKGKGCKILEGDCGIYGTTCGRGGQGGCFYDYTFQAVCQRNKHTDMCHFFSMGKIGQNDCRYPENSDEHSKNIGEYFGLRSNCFTGEMYSDGR